MFHDISCLHVWGFFMLYQLTPRFIKIMDASKTTMNISTPPKSPATLEPVEPRGTHVKLLGWKDTTPWVALPDVVATLLRYQLLKHHLKHPPKHVMWQQHKGQH